MNCIKGFPAQKKSQYSRWSALATLRIMARDLPFQLQPRNQLCHPRQKHLAVGLALLGLILGFRKVQLAHDRRLSSYTWAMTPLSTPLRASQGLLNYLTPDAPYTNSSPLLAPPQHDS